MNTCRYMHCDAIMNVFFSFLPYFLHIRAISGDSLIPVVFLVFFYIFSIYGQYLETLQMTDCNLVFLHIFSIYDKYLEIVQIHIKPILLKYDNLRKF